MTTPEPPADGFTAAAAGLTGRDYAVNAAAEYTPANWADGSYRPPCIRIGAILVFTYAADQMLHVSVGAPDAPMELAVQGETVHRHATTAGTLLAAAESCAPDSGAIAAALTRNGWIAWEDASMLGFRVTSGGGVTVVEFAPGPGRMAEAAAMRRHLADATTRAAARLRAAGYPATAEAGYIIIRASGQTGPGPGVAYDIPVNAAAEYLSSAVHLASGLRAGQKGRRLPGSCTRGSAADAGNAADLGIHESVYLVSVPAAEVREYTPAHWDDDAWCPPAVRIGDILVFAYLRHGVLQVSVDLDDVDPATSPFALYGEGHCVPMLLTVHGQKAFSAFQPGGPHDYRASRHAGPATGRP